MCYIVMQTPFFVACNVVFAYLYNRYYIEKKFL